MEEFDITGERELALEKPPRIKSKKIRAQASRSRNGDVDQIIISNFHVDSHPSVASSGGAFCLLLFRGDVWIEVSIANLADMLSADGALRLLHHGSMPAPLTSVFLLPMSDTSAIPFWEERWTTDLVTWWEVELLVPPHPSPHYGKGC